MNDIYRTITLQLATQDIAPHPFMDQNWLTFRYG